MGRPENRNTPDYILQIGEIDVSDKIIWAATFLEGPPKYRYADMFTHDCLSGTAKECSWDFFKEILQEDLTKHLDAKAVWKLKDQWLTTNQKDGQAVKDSIKELRDLEIQIGYKNLGLEMRRDRFVSGLKKGLKERVEPYVRTSTDWVHEREGWRQLQR
jgi:hypothetical protein